MFTRETMIKDLTDTINTLIRQIYIVSKDDCVAIVNPVASLDRNFRIEFTNVPCAFKGFSKDIKKASKTICKDMDNNVIYPVIQNARECYKGKIEGIISTLKFLGVTVDKKALKVFE